MKENNVHTHVHNILTAPFSATSNEQDWLKKINLKKVKRWLTGFIK